MYIRWAQINRDKVSMTVPGWHHHGNGSSHVEHHHCPASNQMVPMFSQPREGEGELCLAHNNNLPDNLGLVLLVPWSEPKLDVTDLVHHVH